MLSMTLLVGTILALLSTDFAFKKQRATAKDARSLLALGSQGARVDARASGSLSQRLEYQ